jgi:Uncharacterized conserved protein containing a ferredoxin-like domain
MLSQRDFQTKGYCPGYFKYVRISGKILSPLLLTKRDTSSNCQRCRHLRCRDVCPVKLDLSRSGLGGCFRILVTIQISVSLSRWRSRWEKCEVDVHVQQHARDFLLLLATQSHSSSTKLDFVKLSIQTYCYRNVSHKNLAALR